MTSLAFILGVMPLVFASGAGQEGRHSVGTAVAGGMLFATFLNILFIPVLYVVIQTIRGGGSGPAPAEQSATPCDRSPFRVLRVFVVAFLAATIAATSSSAQGIERLTFQEAIDRAIRNNPTVAQATAGIMRAEAILRQVRSSSLPSLAAAVAVNISNPVTFDGQSIVPAVQTQSAATFGVPILAPVAWAQRNQAGDQIVVGAAEHEGCSAAGSGCGGADVSGHHRAAPRARPEQPGARQREGALRVREPALPGRHRELAERAARGTGDAERRNAR